MRTLGPVHPYLTHLLRSWAVIGFAMVAMAACAALTGCGGGDEDGPTETIPTPPCPASAPACSK